MSSTRISYRVNAPRAIVYRALLDAHPGFIAGIPAVPWIMPYLFGVVLLRRTGDEQQ